MEKLIFINKNWPSNPQIGCLLKLNDIVYACEVEPNLITKLKVEFEKQVDDEDSLDLDDFLKYHISLILKWFVCVLF
jgi:hypothetical protein